MKVRTWRNKAQGIAEDHKVIAEDRKEITAQGCDAMAMPQR
jgi:hypothetical protein